MILPHNTRFFLYGEPADMRRGFDRLAGMVAEHHGWDALDGAAYLFVNRRADRIKMLLWDGDGFLLLYKRLEAGRFSFPGAGPRELSAVDLHLVLAGIELRGRRQAKRYRRKPAPGSG